MYTLTETHHICVCRHMCVCETEAEQFIKRDQQNIYQTFNNGDYLFDKAVLQYDNSPMTDTSKRPKI